MADNKLCLEHTKAIEVLSVKLDVYTAQQEKSNLFIQQLLKSTLDADRKDTRVDKQDLRKDNKVYLDIVYKFSMIIGAVALIGLGCKELVTIFFK